MKSVNLENSVIPFVPLVVPSGRGNAFDEKLGRGNKRKYQIIGINGIGGKVS
jgi:hypothetical protein